MKNNKLCPTCKLGKDTDGDGNCPLCKVAKYQRVFVAKKNIIFDNERHLVGRMSSSTMARRAANALNEYKPNEKGY